MVNFHLNIKPMELKDVKAYLNKPVKYAHSTYEFVECALWKDRTTGKLVYSAWLKDVKANCVVKVPLEKVKIE